MFPQTESSEDESSLSNDQSIYFKFGNQHDDSIIKVEVSADNMSLEQSFNKDNKEFRAALIDLMQKSPLN